MSIISDADDDDDEEEEGDGDRDVASRISVTHLSNTGSSEGAGDVHTVWRRRAHIGRWEHDGFAQHVVRKQASSPLHSMSRHVSHLMLHSGNVWQDGFQQPEEEEGTKNEIACAEGGM